MICPNSEKGPIFRFGVLGLKILGSGGRWWALLRISLYNQVLGRGLMGSRVAPEPPLARSRVKILVLGGNNTFWGKQQPRGVARATAHARHGPRGAHRGPHGPPWGPRGPKGPLGPPWAPWAPHGPHGARGVREPWRARPPGVVVSPNKCYFDKKPEF